jgi:aromatic-L-amino-acid decarboxylase
VIPLASPQTARDTPDSGPIPERGAEPGDPLEEAANLLFARYTTSCHPRFLGFVPSVAAPIGALGEPLAAAVNPSTDGRPYSPVSTAIVQQVIRWMAELIGYPPDCDGLLVSGGNASNFAGLLAARHAKSTEEGHSAGLMGERARRLRVYATSETHAWLQQASDVCGLGTDAIRWIPVDTQLRMDPTALRAQVQEDIAAGDLPSLVIGTTGTVRTSAVDLFPALAAICGEYDLWLHVDGTYGGFAALLLHERQEVEVPADLEGIRFADSVAVAPHTWLYAPLEVGCILVRDQQALRETFGSHTHSLYDMEEVVAALDDEKYRVQPSHGFPALKVWLALRQVGRAGYVEMIADDIWLAQELYRLVEAHPELQAFTQGLSITTFRYVPPGLAPGSQEVETYLTFLSTELLHRLQRSGEAFLSHTVVRGMFLLRACCPSGIDFDLLAEPFGKCAPRSGTTHGDRRRSLSRRSLQHTRPTAARRTSHECPSSKDVRQQLSARGCYPGTYHPGASHERAARHHHPSCQECGGVGLPVERRASKADHAAGCRQEQAASDADRGTAARSTGRDHYHHRQTDNHTSYRCQCYSPVACGARNMNSTTVQHSIEHQSHT